MLTPTYNSKIIGDKQGLKLYEVLSLTESLGFVLEMRGSGHERYWT